MNKYLSRNKEGFTLIEILVVIAILAVIAVAVFVALNPAQRLADARNSRRVNDVNNLLTAIHECIVDNDGVVSNCGLSSPLTPANEIGGCLAGAAACTGTTDCVNLEASNLVTQGYLRTMPLDPLGGSATTTGYSVEVDANGIVIVSSCNAELGEVIEVAR